MKRMIWAFLLIIATVVIYLLGMVVVGKICDEEIDTLKQCMEDIDNQNLKEASKKLKNNKDITRLTHYIYKTKIEDIEDSIINGYYCLKENDATEAKICLNKSIDLLDEVKDELKINIHSFF